MEAALLDFLSGLQFGDTLLYRLFPSRVQNQMASNIVESEAECYRYLFAIFSS